MHDGSFFAALAGDPRTFLIEGERTYSFDQLLSDISAEEKLVREATGAGQPCYLIEAENNYETFVKFLTAMRGNWPALLCPSYQFRSEPFRAALRRETGTDFFLSPLGEPLHRAGAAGTARHPLLAGAHREAIFLVRTSGSSGSPFKFIAHRYANFVSHHRKNAPHFQRTFAFSPADSIAGIETLTEVLVHQATLVAPTAKLSPDSVAETLREREVDYFQTTPTFLNLMLLSRRADRASLPQLKKIAFGSEPPLQESLTALAAGLPGVELKQTYGMSEVGILQTSPASDPALVAFDQARDQVRLDSEGGLEVRTEKQMLGYLNHPAKITADGWFVTGDRALQDENGLFRILGRKDDTINVAGRKFFPTELENLLAHMENVADATVRREKNEFLGDAIQVEILLQDQEDEEMFRSRFKKFLDQHVPFFMHPHRLSLSAGVSASERFKKIRAPGTA